MSIPLLSSLRGCLAAIVFTLCIPSLAVDAPQQKSYSLKPLPTPEATPGLVAALERGGADLIELGVPFSDPVADGPIIQLAGDRAIKAGTTVAKVLEMAPI